MIDDDSSPGEFDDAALSALERSLPRVTPDRRLFTRILAEIQGEATVVPLHRKTIRRSVVPAVSAIAAIAAVVLIVFFATNGDGTRPVDARAAVAGKSDPAVSGEAVLYGSRTDGGTVHISLRAVPPAPSGHHYEVWVLRRNAGASMEAVGAFTPTSSRVDLDLELPGPGEYAAFDVSIEENGGPPAHSDTSLAGGTFS